MRASYLGRPITADGWPGRPDEALSGPFPWSAVTRELGLLQESLRHATRRERLRRRHDRRTGLGKTRLVAECRRLFMGWVGAASGRLPLWLEGRAASYQSAQPYGLYRQVLSHWVGTGPEEPDELAWRSARKGCAGDFCWERRTTNCWLFSPMSWGSGPGGPPLPRDLAPKRSSRQVSLHCKASSPACSCTAPRSLSWRTSTGPTPLPCG